MFRFIHSFGVGAVCLLTVTACAPPGYQDAAFTKVAWPTVDQALTLNQRIEIEGRLKALKYLSEPADGVMTRSSRNAIRAFQTDIGAPATGVVSLPLLDALQTNTAFLTPQNLKKVNSGVIVQGPSRPPVRARAAATNSTSTPTSAGSSGDGGGGGGGSGGSGAGAWN